MLNLQLRLLRGLIAEQGLAWILPRIVGISRALDLLLSSRVILSEEAQSMGLINFISKDDECLNDALNYAKNMTKFCSPNSMPHIKMQLYDSLEMDRKHSYVVAEKYTAQSLTGADFVEGVKSFVEKCDPKFAPLPSSRPKL